MLIVLKIAFIEIIIYTAKKKKHNSPILSIQFSEYIFIKLSNHRSPILDHFLHSKELSHTHLHPFTMLTSSLSNR